MKVKFKDGTILNCSIPTEQKVFKGGEAAGWILSFSLIGIVTSADIDKIISEENISDLSFISVDEEEKETTIPLTGYDKVSSAVIRYAEEYEQTRVEIHLTKGV